MLCYISVTGSTLKSSVLYRWHFWGVWGDWDFDKTDSLYDKG